LASSHRIAAFIFAATTAIGSHASQFQELFVLAQANDPSYLAAQHMLEANLQIMPQANSALMPEISGKLNKNLALDAGSDGRGYSVQVAVPLRLDAYYGMKAAEQSAAGAHISFEEIHQSLIFSVIERYVTVIKDQHQLSSSMTEIAANEQRLKQVQQQVALGLSSNVQLQDILATFQQSQVDLLQVQQNLSLARTDLENLTNQALPEQLPALASSFSASLIPTDSLENWFTVAKNNNLGIAINGFATQEAYHKYQAIDVGLYPKAGITMRQDYSTGNGKSQMLSIEVSGTFYDGGLNQAQTKEAKETWHARQQQGQALLKTTQQQVRRWHQAIDTSRQQIQALAQLHTSVQASLTGKNKEYELGLRDISDVLDAEKLVFSAQRSWANARLDLVLNQLRLKQTSGLISGDDLTQLDQWFN
jgi:outer membrane protein